VPGITRRVRQACPPFWTLVGSEPALVARLSLIIVMR
jgi:hypothetical protein